jgi:hypothetical protein
MRKHQNSGLSQNAGVGASTLNFTPSTVRPASGKLQVFRALHAAFYGITFRPATLQFSRD